MNDKQKTNGQWAEAYAYNRLLHMYPNERVLFVDTLYDILIEGVPVEVKSCQRYVKAVDRRGGKRRGRFKLEKEQHEYLIKNNGLYLFIVHDKLKKKGIALIPASKVPFKPQLCWSTVMREEDFDD